jgi:hypothetical protein
MRPEATLLEERMPRFVGKRSHGIWWDIAAVIVLAIVVVVVLQLTGTIHLFGALPAPARG